jgi:hypothetical protein
MKQNNSLMPTFLVCSLFLIFQYGCSQKAIICAKEGEQFSRVFTDDYPEKCCNNFKEWNSGMDTRLSIGNQCFETGAMAGSPVGTCINCGNGKCEDIENICNCQKDCEEIKNSDFKSIEEFCQSSSWNSLSKECQAGMNLPICNIC